MPAPSPHDLVDLRALQDGDDEALDRLIGRWERPLLAFAWRYLHNTTDARDAVAETFVRLYQHRLRLRADTNLAAWLFTAVANRCRNELRRRQRHPASSLDERREDAEGGELPAVRVPADGGPTPGDALLHQEVLDALTQAIDRLPHDLKTALLLHHFENLSYRDIGLITGCQERGVETRLYRARQALRQALSAWRVDAVGR